MSIIYFKGLYINILIKYIISLLIHLMLSGFMQSKKTMVNTNLGCTKKLYNSYLLLNIIFFFEKVIKF